MAEVICVSGSVGCGKTVYAKKLAKKLGYTYVDVKKVVKEHGLDAEWDSVRHCSVVDEKKLVKILVALIKKGDNLVIDSHMSHFIPPRYVSQVIICKTPLKTLERRLKRRRYSLAKIRENLDVEIFDMCFVEAVELGHVVKVVAT